MILLAIILAPLLTVQWDPVTTLSDGTVIDPTGMSYMVYGNKNILCETINTSCNVSMKLKRCVDIHAIAILAPNMSANSNIVRACSSKGGGKEDFCILHPTHKRCK
jgi:hypothetical protein